MPMVVYTEEEVIEKCDQAAADAAREIAQQRDRAQKKADRLGAAVLKYSTHTSDCRYRGGHDCNCGLEELRNEIQKE